MTSYVLTWPRYSMRAPERCDAGGFLRLLPALDEARIVLGEVADDGEGRVAFGRFGLRQGLQEDERALAWIERAEEEDAVLHGPGCSGTFLRRLKKMRAGGWDRRRGLWPRAPRGEARAGVVAKGAGDHLGVGEDARGLAKGEAERGLLGEDGRAFFEAIAQRLDLDEDGRQLDASCAAMAATRPSGASAWAQRTSKGPRLARKSRRASASE